MGVLVENSFLRACMPEILHVTNERRHLCAELDALVSSVYHTPGELESIVSGWAEELNRRYITPIRRVLLHNPGAVGNYRTWFHCFFPTARQDKPQDWVPARWDRALSGGHSGHLAIVRALRALNEGEKLAPTDFSHCATVLDSEEARKGLKQTNLYLLDSPVTRGPDGQAASLNWVMNEALRLLRRGGTVPPLTVGMEVIPQGSLEADRYPNERIRMCYGGEKAYATPAWDYGFILRAPSPFDQSTFVLIMAGVHAPATHAAAEVVTDPRRMDTLMGLLRAHGMDDHEPCYFEAAFKVRRTFLPQDLGEVEWLHHVALRKGSQ
jgi:hypothetical protein